MSIYFYEDTYYQLSNFSAHAVRYHGILYPTSEHAYQAAKFNDPQIQQEILSARSPLEAKQIANVKYKKHFLPGWHDIKAEVMYEIVRAKALQQSEVREALMRTGAEEIIENSPVDSFWGCGEDKNGHNELGKIWMRIRDELRSA